VRDSTQPALKPFCGVCDFPPAIKVFEKYAVNTYCIGLNFLSNFVCRGIKQQTQGLLIHKGELTWQV